MASGIETKGLLPVLGWLLMLSPGLRAGAQDDAAALLRNPTFESMEQVTVTSVSKQEEDYFSAAASVHLVSGEEIRRSGVRLLPEALRLAPGVEVAASSSRAYAVTMRGFNGTSANKLLPMIDGRSLYSQRFAGTIWDVRNLPLEEVEQIELIGGPGGTTWGANAMNGVINIITKDARHTQGDRVSFGAGTFEEGFFYGRHGFTVGRHGWARVSLQAFQRGDSEPVNLRDNNDAWGMLRAGFRYDGDRADGGQVTVTGDLFRSTADQLIAGAPARARSSGGHLLARTQQPLGASRELRLQAYLDVLRRDSGGNQTESDVLDLDALVRPVAATGGLAVAWGGNARLSRLEDAVNSPGFSSNFTPPQRWFRQAALFVEATHRPAAWRGRVTAGLKAEYNDFTHAELLPSVRAAWSAGPDTVLWAAWSRAARIPSRFENDQVLTISGPGFVNRTLPSPDLKAEVLHAFEVGWRWRQGSRLSADLSLFYHDYSRLVTSQGTATPAGVDSVLFNLGGGNSHGAELQLTWQPRDWWRLQASYTYLEMDLALDPRSNDTSLLPVASVSPRHQGSLRSSWNLGSRWEIDAWWRAVDALPQPNRVIPGYQTADLRVGVQLDRGWELAVVGQNLLQPRHREFRFSSVQAAVARGAYLRIDRRF